MHDADTLPDNEQDIAIEPDSHIMGRRLIALIIDSIIIAFMISWCTRAFGIAQIQTGTNITIPGVLFGPGGLLYSIPNGSGGTITWNIELAPIWQTIFVFCYFSLQEFFFGATIGKFFMSLRVISQHSDSTYTRLTITGALLRNLIRFVDASGTYILGLVFCICSPKRRRLGDMLAKTLVVRQESVPYITIPRRQIRYGAQVVILLCIIIAVGCPIFAYFGQPPITIQNDIKTQVLFPGEQIGHYTLGEKTWAKDDSGRPTVTYPIQFMFVPQIENQTSTQTPIPTLSQSEVYDCKGSITLFWQWSMFSWQLGETSNPICTNHA